MKTVRLTAHGLVQGVGFRFMTKRAADKIGIHGIVRNQQDGTVYIEASGSAEKIKQFIEIVRNSPSPSGHVTQLEVDEDVNIELRDNFVIL